MNGRVRVDTSSPPLLSTYPFGVLLSGITASTVFLVALALPISSPVAKIALPQSRHTGGPLIRHDPPRHPPHPAERSTPA